jgi:hypothetical protein
MRNYGKLLLTNCPNCGAQLNAAGDCAYCKTKVRYENSIRLSEDDPFYNQCEILIKRERKDADGNKYIVYVPFIGRLTSVEMSTFVDSCYVPDITGGTKPYRMSPVNEMRLMFDGYVAESFRPEMTNDTNYGE